MRLPSRTPVAVGVEALVGVLKYLGRQTKKRIVRLYDPVGR